MLAALIGSRADGLGGLAVALGAAALALVASAAWLWRSPTPHPAAGIVHTQPKGPST
jgi:hypothetical protein